MGRGSRVCWDKNSKKLVRGAIRLPIIFFGLNVMLRCKKQTNITNFIKLAILNFLCPGKTYISNFTRRPLMMNFFLPPQARLQCIFNDDDVIRLLGRMSHSRRICFVLFYIQVWRKRSRRLKNGLSINQSNVYFV